jgi:hypothetical protein
MALYVSLSLLAVLLAAPSGTDESRVRLALTVGLTAIGLLLAHQVAFRMSTRLVNRGEVDTETARLLAAQSVGGLAVAVLAVVPVLLFGAAGLRVAELLLLGVVAFVGYLTARVKATSRIRSLGYVLGVVAMVGVVLVVKSLAGH